MIMKEEKTPNEPAETSEIDAVESAPELASVDAAPMTEPVPKELSEAAKLLKDWTPEVADQDQPKTKQANKTNEANQDALADPETDKAVEEIMAADSDEVLEIEDAVKEAENEPDPKPSFGQHLKNIWSKPGVRWAVAITGILVVLSVIIVPVERYFVLNLVGVRSSSSLTVLDASTRQPLKNTTVRIGGVQATTDSEGNAKLYKVKLGKQDFIIEKRGFARIKKSLTVGWGSNPLGNFEITPTGTQYDFVITDYVSEKPLNKVELTSNEATALSDEKGHAKLTIEKPGDDDIMVEVKRDGYRTDTITLKPDAKDKQAVALVPARKHVFSSKRSGKLDLYSIYADGQQEKLLVPASGSERQADVVIVPHPTDNLVAYVSTRGNQANSDGYLLSNLILVDSSSGEKTNIAASERFNILGWSGSRLVYVQITQGQSAPSPERYKLMSYDYKSSETKQLANANYFNDALLFAGQAYYAPNGGLQSDSTKFYRVNPDGSNNQAIFDQEVWQIIRVSYEELALSVQQQWFTYIKGTTSPVKRSAAPSSQQTRTYVDSPDAKHSAWVDVRDGKGVLISYDLGTKTDKVIASISGLTYPIQWLDANTLVYRVITPKETADYVVSIDGGSPHKLADVTPTAGLGAAPKSY